MDLSDLVENRESTAHTDNTTDCTDIIHSLVYIRRDSNRYRLDKRYAWLVELGWTTALATRTTTMTMELCPKEKNKPQVTGN